MPQVIFFICRADSEPREGHGEGAGRSVSHKPGCWTKDFDVKL
jgi:hypothetical protein